MIRVRSYVEAPRAPEEERPTPDQLAFDAPGRLASGALWLLGSNLLYAACQWGTLMALAKIGTPISLGHFGLALAVATPVVLVTGFALRAVQATDVYRRYAFADYLQLRLAANVLAAAIIATVAALVVDAAAAAVLVPLGIAKLAEATSETCYGLAQRHDRMRFVALSKMVRGALGLAAMVTVMVLGWALADGAWAMATTWVAFLLAIDLPAASRLEPVLAPPHVGRLWRLARESAALGAVNGVLALSQSVPRYVLQATQGPAAVGYFTALSSVGPALDQLAGSIGHAAAPRLGWAAGTGDGQFRRLVLRLLAIAMLIGGALVCGAAWGGGLFLHLAYAADYATYRLAFVLIMLGAAFSLMNTVSYFALVASRRHGTQLAIQTLGFVVSAVASLALAPRLGVDGAAMAVAGGAAVMAVVAARRLLATRRAP